MVFEMSFSIETADEGYGGSAGALIRAFRGGIGGGFSSSSKGSVSSSIVEYRSA